MPGALLGDSLDDVDQFAAAVSVLAGESHERARGDDDRPPFWALADGDAATAAELEQSLVAQRPQGAKDCVRVDPEHGREVPSGRQPLTRFRFAIGNRAAELCGDLLMELNVVVAIDLDAEHGASDTSFIGHGCQPDASATSRCPQGPHRGGTSAGPQAPPDLRGRCDDAAAHHCRRPRAHRRLGPHLRPRTAEPCDEPPTPPRAHPAPLALQRAPYIGVSCRTPNSIACDRVGLAIWLRRPVARLTATINSRTVAMGLPCGSARYRETCSSYCRHVARDQPCGTYFEGF